MSKKRDQTEKKMVQRNRTQRRKISLSAYFKAISYYFGFSGPTRCIIYRTSFTEFGGELGDQQRPTLERNDMKLGAFN